MNEQSGCEAFELPEEVLEAVGGGTDAAMDPNG